MNPQVRDEIREEVRTQIERLVLARKAQRMTLTDVAIRTGWAPTTVRRFETGLSNPTLTQCMIYAHAIGGEWETVITLRGNR